MGGINMNGRRLSLAVVTVVMAPACSPVSLPQGPATAAQTVMHLVVGDRVQLNALLSGDSSAVSYRSADSTIAAINGGKELVAVRPGTTVVTSIATIPDSVRVMVTTRRQAVNDVINEVCPNDDERYFRDSTPVTSAVQRIHEYHDCQRLIQGGQYRALTGIFAHKNVDTLQSWQDFRDGRLAAIIVSFVTKGEPMSYDALGLKAGVNCLVLQATAKDEWQARIINQSAAVIQGKQHHYGDCADGLTWRDTTSASAHPLIVRVQHGFDMVGRVIAPPVARWDWDATHALNYIGVKCDADTWCEIGPRELTVSPTRYIPNTERAIFKGYYDEQFLADSGGQTVSGVYGTIMPGRHTSDVRGMSYKVRQWYHVASLSFLEHAPSPSHTFQKYTKWYFAAPPTGQGAPATANLELFPLAGVLFPKGYRGQLNHNAVPDSEIVFHWHPGSVRVATVRWRWLYRDESTWSYCDPEGCCERQTAEK
jgi:hypothetical protein